VTLSILTLRIMPRVILLNIVNKSIMLRVIMLIVVMLNVVAPGKLSSLFLLINPAFSLGFQMRIFLAKSEIRKKKMMAQLLEKE